MSAERKRAAAYGVTAALRVEVACVWAGRWPNSRERFELKIGGLVALSVDACDLNRAQLRAAVTALGLDGEDEALLLRAVAAL